ncbi:MAG: lipoate--protein ligase family protein [Myxococcales bacterium]|nr:lipoate--protein ligase family protein [Myxococcales bacterium]
MAGEFRIIDTGVREGRANIAFDAALIEERQAGRVPDTIRFMRFPPTALIGRHQDLSAEVDLDYCARHGIGTVRRITGGGAIYLDEGQLGWELVFSKAALGIAALPDVAREICNAVAAGLGRLGVAASFRPRNDIEVDGRKISGTGGFYDGDVLIYQGTVLVNMDAQRMSRVLRVPEAKLAKRDLDTAAQRVVTLAELLGEELPSLADIRQALTDGFAEVLGIKAVPGEISAAEEALARRHFDDEIGTDEFVAEIDDPAGKESVLAGSYTSAGGTINAFVKLEGPTRAVLQRVLLSGDFFVTPPRVVFDLEAHLKGTPVAELDEAIESFFAARRVDTLSVAPGDFRAAIAAALTTDAANVGL